MPEKLKNRVRFYSNFDEISSPFDKKDFPEEFGGNMKTDDLIGKHIQNLNQLLKLISSFKESLKTTLAAKTDFFLAYNTMKVNRNLYPTSVINCDVDSLSTSLENLLNPCKSDRKTSKQIIEID